MKLLPILVALVAIALVSGVVYYLVADSHEVDRETANAALDSATAALERGDASEVLKETAVGIAANPFDFRLHALRIHAFCKTGRFKDAIDAAESATDAAESAAELEEHRFWTARAHMGRFIDANDRGDFNRAESDLRMLANTPTFGGAAKVLLGLGLLRKGEKDAAKPLLESGLASGTAKAWLDDLSRAEKELKALGS